MYTTDRESFRTILNDLALTFGKDLSPELEALYFEALKDVPLAAIQGAAVRCRRNGRYFPKPAELRPKDDWQAPAPISAAYDGWRGDVWDVEANLHFLRYTRARIGKNPAFFGVRDTPEWARRVLRFLVWVHAWAADMRDREKPATVEQQRSVWVDLMRRAEAELREEMTA